jgi:hypothetical protein
MMMHMAPVVFAPDSMQAINASRTTEIRSTEFNKLLGYNKIQEKESKIHDFEEVKCVSREPLIINEQPAKNL